MGRILSAKSLSKRILVAVFFSLAIIMTYFSVSSYLAFLKNTEEHLLDKLELLANTLAISIDGQEHEALVQRFHSKDAITSNTQDSIYQKYQALLAEAARNNMINTDIYTLVFSPQDSAFNFVVTSAEKPYYMHLYEQFPKGLLDKWQEGARLGQYQSENGTWLSAFTPIKNAQGQTVAVIEVDRRFDEFRDIAFNYLIKDLGISLLIFLAVAGVLYSFLRLVIKNEEASKQELEESLALIKQKNKNIKDSINYAKRIQDALIPDANQLKSHFPESYVFFRGKDVVSGDFPWMLSLSTRNEVLVASVDCTGHGVPGALLSIIGYFLLNDIIQSKGIIEPGEILNELHRSIVNTLSQDSEASQTHDGMDVALMKVNTQTLEVQFAGAHRPLFHLRPSVGLEEIKGERLPIGGTQYQKRKKEIHFNTHTIQAQPGDSFHFFSDGFPDQIGGPNGKRFMNKNLKSLLVKHKHDSMGHIGQTLQTAFEDWKGQESQLDDVLIIGIQV